MTEKYELKQVCGEYKFYEKGDSFPLTEKQILTKLNENEKLKEENNELKLQLEAFKDKLCELGVSDVKLYGKRYYTELEEWIE